MSIVAAIRSSSVMPLSRVAIKSTNKIILRLARCVQSTASSQQTSDYSFTIPTSSLHEVQPDSKLTNFIDIMAYINKMKDVMAEKNPFFNLMKDESFTPRERLCFTPYMGGFAMGFGDFADYILKIDKPDNELTMLERKVNEYVAEDDFHYNFFLHDLEALGSKLEDYGTHQGLLRHHYRHESAAGRRTNYRLMQTVALHEHPILRMLTCELVEAGLFAFFTTIYSNIVKADNDLPTLDYYGDAHVGLELDHAVTAQFSGKEEDMRLDPENAWMHEELPEDVAEACRKGIVMCMPSFDQMFSSCRHIVLATREGHLDIKPENFTARGHFSMQNILGE